MDDKSVLVFAYGNLSRGDDALAPLLIERLKQLNINKVCGHSVKYLSEYQMQIEHVLDMQNCARVLLIDAHQILDKPFKFYRVQEKQETDYTTHGMSASTLLHTYRKTLGIAPPFTCILAIQGIAFELGQPLSDTASDNLQLAEEFCRQILLQDDFNYWDKALKSVNDS